MKQRIITAFIAGFFFLTFLIIGHLPFVIFVYIMATIGLAEILKMSKRKLISIPGIISIIFLWTILSPVTIFTYTKIEVATIGVLLLLALTVLLKNKMTFEHAGLIFISIMYIGIGFYSLIVTRDDGLAYIFFIIVVIWATDTGAYFIGKAFGKHKLWPEISPKKTIEGALGGIACALAIAFIYYIFVPLQHEWALLLLYAFLISIFGQIGDLVESALKRHFKVKDSGNLLPGHGGILDRFDSLLFVLPILQLLHFT